MAKFFIMRLRPHWQQSSLAKSREIKSGRRCRESKLTGRRKTLRCMMMATSMERLFRSSSPRSMKGRALVSNQVVTKRKAWMVLLATWLTKSQMRIL